MPRPKGFKRIQSLREAATVNSAIEKLQQMKHGRLAIIEPEYRTMLLAFLKLLSKTPMDMNDGRFRAFMLAVKAGLLTYETNEPPSIPVPEAKRSRSRVIIRRLRAEKRRRVYLHHLIYTLPRTLTLSTIRSDEQYASDKLEDLQDFGFHRKEL